MRAAEKAERREGNREADRFYSRALEVLGADDEEQALELRLRRARVTTFLGDFRPAREQLVAVADGAQRLGRPDLRCGALLGLANIDWKQGLAADARPRLQEAPSLAGEIGDSALRVRAASFGNVHAWFDGDADAVIRELPSASRSPRSSTTAAAHRGSHGARHRLLELRPARRGAAADEVAALWPVRAAAPATRRGHGVARLRPLLRGDVGQPRSSPCRRSTGSSARATPT